MGVGIISGECTVRTGHVLLFVCDAGGGIYYTVIRVLDMVSVVSPKCMSNVECMDFLHCVGGCDLLVIVMLWTCGQCCLLYMWDTERTGHVVSVNESLI